MLSFLVMVLLKRWNRFSVIGVSMAGGVFHNVGQILVAMAVVENASLSLIHILYKNLTLRQSTN